MCWNDEIKGFWLWEWWIQDILKVVYILQKMFMDLVFSFVEEREAIRSSLEKINFSNAFPKARMSLPDLKVLTTWLWY